MHGRHDFLLSSVQIFISLGDVDGKWSEEKPMYTKWHDDFEKGNTDVINLSCPGLSKVSDVCIRRDQTCPKDDWCVRRIMNTTIFESIHSFNNKNLIRSV